jgi:hypothetical protein
MFNQQRADQLPFRQAGLTAEQEYMAMLGLDTSGFASAQQDSADQSFDAGAAYLRANPDVAADPRYANNPSLHYHEYGLAEGRKWPTAPKVATAGYETAKPAAGIGGASSTSQQDAFAKFRSAPGYQFGLDEGNKSVQASAAARGGLNSGATLKALMRYGTGYADQQGVTPYMNRLATLFGGAQQATNQVGQAGQNYASQVGQNNMQAGQARAQGIYDSANAWSNFYNDTAKTAGNAYGQYKTGGY